MTENQPTVSDIFRRAQGMRKENPDWTYNRISEQLVKEFSAGPTPSLRTLTIPEQDARAPEEDWSAGLSLVGRGIQTENWKEIMQGIMLSLEQTENYERARGPEGERDDWHNRNKGIDEATSKGVGKWMPQELVDLMEKRLKK
ncbi:MAG TPA: hypothetical protein VLB68_23930 [Pyrinomonadaceae bacterium]|nr:hypothetical protein [Pyrinomonadaceae bacterium]